MANLPWEKKIDLSYSTTPQKTNLGYIPGQFYQNGMNSLATTQTQLGLNLMNSPSTSNFGTQMINQGMQTQQQAFQNPFQKDQSSIFGKDIPKEQSFKDKLGGLSSSGMMGAIGGAADTVNNLVSSFSKDTTQGPNGNLRAGIDQGWNAVSDAAANFGPWGKAASAAMKAVGALNSVQGAIFGATDNMTKGDAILDSPLGFLTGVGWINQAFGDTSDTITKDEETFSQVGSSYGGTGNTVDDALTKSGKKYGLFSGGARHQANREIAEAKRQQNMMADIAQEANTRNALKSSMSAINGNRRAFQMQGGYNQAAIHAAKYGMRFERAKNIIKNYNIPKIEPIIEEFKDGGVIDDFVIQEPPEDYQLPEEIVAFQKGGSFNIIPEGALHARKHNIDLEGITKKGIPVISKSEGGEIQQQAEIEHSEIIFRLEVTQKLEELAKINEDSDKTQKEKDEAAIEAGKLLVEEILHNTEDKVQALINE